MNKFCCIILVNLCLISCDDIFVKDISDKTVNIIAPISDTTLNDHEVSLVWETIEGADNYQVIIVSPSFSNIQKITCDSITTDYKLKLTLENGSYEYSVQAHNFAYSSLKSSRQFTVNVP